MCVVMDLNTAYSVSAIHKNYLRFDVEAYEVPCI